MQCEHPVRIHDPTRVYIYDRFGQDLNTILVPCNKCAACQSQKRKNWFFRLKVESNKCVVSYVVTLTYNDIDIPPLTVDSDTGKEYHPICYEDVQLFNKRLRKKIGSFRFFAVSEYGPENLRPHYHIVYFFDRLITRYDFDNAVFNSWFPQTRITIDETNDRAAQYVLSYCLSLHGDIPKVFWPRIRCSTKPFIGSGLLDNEEFLRYLHINKTDLSNYVGYKQRLPRILRDRIFDDEEKAFFKAELGRLIERKKETEFIDLLKYEKKYGLKAAVRKKSDERTAFNQSVARKSKLKSIK